MSMKLTTHNTFTANEKSDDLGELGDMPSSNSITTCSESDPPDGGFGAWATALGCFLMHFCGFGYISSFGVYQDYYTRIYLTNQPPSAISWIGALTPFLAVSVALISGPLYDRGWFHRLMIVGSLLQSLSLFALSFTKPGQFYLVSSPINLVVDGLPMCCDQPLMVQGVLSGFGIGLTYAPSIAVVSQHFSKKRTLVMSLTTSGAPLGAMIHPIMLNHLFNGTVGFARGVRASAGFVSALLFVACLSMRTRALPAPTTSYSAVARKCSREVLFILMTVGSLLFQIGFFFPVFYLQLDSVKHDIDINFSFYSLVIMNAACFIGRCTAGMIAPYTGVLNFTIVSTVACSVLVISMISLSDIASVVVLGLGYGYFSGVYIALLAPLVTVFTPDLSELGARMGICFAVISFSGLISGPISGALLTSQYRWWIASLFSGLIAIVGSSMFVMMRLIIYRREINGRQA
ncbi:major facilitator superfamily domain-containing protein [Suillus clintonianus]|uniref:major facilitator superfamily domain-containing protein n=1 Tax=Suillus clintonianus TaxID=1904413 RepID=UPI001B864CA6|nr:major facilitator superfamily domain-containing protein [Suillus clintonianus]KAG2133319.1 major facilitator superfamily domain-containing protein [Suillus clintonianus]